MNTKKNAKISNDKRQDLIDYYYNQSYDLKEAAKLTKMKYATAWKIINIFKKTSRINSLSKGGARSGKLTEEILEKIEDIVSINPDFTLKEIKEKIESENDGLHLSLQSINNALKN